jgi:CBS domain-containing protein
MKVKKFMVPLSKVVCAPEDSTLRDVSKLMLSSHVGSIVIYKKDEKGAVAIGLITKSDLVAAMISEKDLDQTLIGDIVHHKLIICYEGDDRGDVAKYMVNNKIHHVLVRNDDRRIVGITSCLDLAKEVVEESEDTFPYLRSLFGISKKEEKEFDAKLDNVVNKIDSLLPHTEYAMYMVY